MTHRTHQTRLAMARPRRLNLEALEPRICLSTYTTVDLVPLPGHDQSVAHGLNDNGLVVGGSYSPGPYAAVVWSVGPTGHVAVDSLPGVDGGTANESAQAIEVNNQGMIAGHSAVDVGGSTVAHATLWTGAFGSYSAHDLGTLEGLTSSYAHSISEPDANGNVWMVGYSYIPNGGNHGVLWQVDVHGTVLSMTDLEPTSSSASADDVKVIGDSVFVAGGYNDGDYFRAVIWQTDFAGVVVGRTVLGTEFTVGARALNSDGDVAGWEWDVGMDGRHGYLYESDSGTITDLGSLGDVPWSDAYGINDHDVVVGEYGTTSKPPSHLYDQHAFVWEDGTMYELQDLVSDRTFLGLSRANDVNNAGEIVGRGSVGRPNDTYAHGFLARPEGGQQAPVAFDDSYTTQPETTLTVAAPGVLGNDTDADGDALTAVLQSDVSGGTLTLHSDGSFMYTPAAGFSGTDSFTYRANDGTADSNVATVTISVASAAPDTYWSTDTPLTITDPHPVKGAKPVNSYLTISETGVLVGTLDIDVTIAHGSMSDLTVTLTSPQAVQKPLLFNGAEWNLASPMEFWGQALDGTWVLTVTDTVKNGIAGTLETWSITVSELTGPGVTVTPTSGLSTSEGGGIATFQVVLNSQPSGLVRINLRPDDTSEGRLQQANSDDVTLTFDATNWRVPQTIVVIGEDDPFADGDIFYTIITIVCESFDPDYVGIDPDDVTLVNLDDGNDTPQLRSSFGSGITATRVTVEQVEQLASYALSLWSTHLAMPTGNDIHVVVADLPPGRLGQANQHTIVVDDNADGAGWFVDRSPWDRAEFLGFTSPASKLVDLLTVVAHEIGHTLGFDHSPDAHDVMAATLPLGTRRLPGMAPVTTQTITPSASDLALLLPESRRDVLTSDPVDDTALLSEMEHDTGADSDLWLLPQVEAQYVDRTRISPEPKDVRILNDVTDEETELLDEALLDLIAAGQKQ